jgi:predicted nucleic acid-binding protein
MRVILDSSAVVALLNEQDASHTLALNVRDSSLGVEDESLLPYEVLAETLNVLGRKLAEAMRFSRQIILSKCTKTERAVL